jgi:outer membrane immunogenic protein
MKTLLLGTAAMTLLATPVLAADLQIAKAPATYNWTGLYLGAHCGGAWGDTKTAGNNGAFDESARAYTLQPSGSVCGGQVGFNVQSGGWFWGIEGDFGYLGVKKSITPNDNFVEVKYGAYGAATARVGLVWDRALLYLKGGAAFAKIRNTATDLDGGVADSSDFSQLNKTRIGWAAGAGIEYGLSQSWSVKFEYLYMGFGNDSATNQDGDVFTHSNSIHTAKAGLNWRFGGGPAVARY